MTVTRDSTTVTVALSGEIDHHSAPAMRKAADDALFAGGVNVLVLDFSAVRFMDSSAVGLILGRCKTAKTVGAKVKVRGLSPRDKKIVRLAGLTSLAEIEDETEGAK